MARFYPFTERAAAPSSESTVRRAFKALADDWIVFPSVRWQSVRGGRQGDGEADFVLLHPQHGCIVLEVKGGRIEIEGGLWFTHDRNGIRFAIKDPFSQAVDSKHALLAYFRALQPTLSAIPPICHAVVFPDAGVVGVPGLQSRSIVIDGEGLLQPEEALKRVLNHWGQANSCTIGPAELKRFVGLLAPTMQIQKRLRFSVAESEAALINLTAQQVAVLNLLRSNRRCVVRGGAGTGKTLLALEKARQLAEDGAEVLLICYNAPLARWLADESQNTRITVATFHALCMKKARELGMRLPSDPTEEWWDKEASEILATWADSFAARVDAIIIDEAQDILDDWLTALCLLLAKPSDSPIYLFADSHQQLYRKGILRVDGWPVAELDLNCRNTVQIAKVVATIWGDRPPTEGAQGRTPIFQQAGNGQLLAVAQEIVDQLIVEEGLKPNQVAVLSDSKRILDHLRELVAGGHAFVEVNGVGIASETIHRFKGLEAQVVVLLLSEEFFGTALQDQLLYVGASRGRSLLYLVGPKALRKRLDLR